MSTHAALVLIHALAATVALGAGIGAFRTRRALPIHCLAVTLMTVSLVGAVAVGWSRAAPGANAVFSGLCAIAVVMAVQAALAWRRRPGTAHEQGLSESCLRAVGFSCVGLVTGLVAVSATRFTSNGVLLTLAPLLTVALGRLLLNRNLARPGGAA